MEIGSIFGLDFVCVLPDLLTSAFDFLALTAVLMSRGHT
jgi:hypothetical protein